MHSKTFDKTIFAKGIIGCKTSLPPVSFTSYKVELIEANDKLQLISATNQSRSRAVMIYVPKEIKPGAHPIVPNDSDGVTAYYFHSYDVGQWIHWAIEGMLMVNTVDFEKTQFDGSFHFIANGRPDEPQVKVTEGIVTLTGPSS